MRALKEQCPPGPGCSREREWGGVSQDAWARPCGETARVRLGKRGPESKHRAGTRGSSTSWRGVPESVGWGAGLVEEGWGLRGRGHRLEGRAAGDRAAGHRPRLRVQGSRQRPEGQARSSVWSAGGGRRRARERQVHKERWRVWCGDLAPRDGSRWRAAAGPAQREEKRHQASDCVC